MSPPASARSLLRWCETQNAEAIQMTSENRLLSEALSVLSAPFDGCLDCSAIEFPSPAPILARSGAPVLQVLGAWIDGSSVKAACERLFRSKDNRGRNHRSTAQDKASAWNASTHCSKRWRSRKSLDSSIWSLRPASLPVLPSFETR